MATNTTTTSHQTLKQLLVVWDHRRRKQQIVLWLSRVLIIGLSVAISLGLISRVRPWLTNGQLALISMLLLAFDGGVLVAVIWLWPRQLIRSAQWFDDQFGLQERTSTALELLENRIHTVEELAQRQIADALTYAEAIAIQEFLPIKIRIYEWISVAWLLFILSVLIFLPNSIARATTQNYQLQAAIDQTADDTRATIEDVANMTTLDDATREALLQSLQAQLETLQDEDVSPEEALATANDIQNMLQSEADEFNQRAEEQRQALENSAEILQEPQQAPAQTLENIQENIPGQTQTEAEDTADMFDRLAEALENTMPEAAAALREAAAALRQGDQQTAQQALADAARTLSEMQNQQQGNEQTAQQLEQAAQMLQQDQQEMAQQSNQEQGQGPSSETSENSQDGAQPQSGEQGAPGNQPDGQQLATEGQQSDIAADGQPQNGQSSSSESSQGATVGNQPGDPEGDTSGSSGEEQAPNYSAPGSEQVYEEVFAPRRPELEAGTAEMNLTAVEGNVPIRERDMAQSPEGDLTVPYNQVFGDYAAAANNALDRGYIPLGLRDIVREYFTSLTPATEANNGESATP